MTPEQRRRNLDEMSAISAEFEGAVTPEQRRVEPLTAEDIRVAIDKACSLTNPRLSEVDWDDVAVLLRRTLATPDPRVEQLEAALREVGALRPRPNLQGSPVNAYCAARDEAVDILRALLRSPQERSGE